MPKDKSAPRNMAGQISLPEGAGEITAMCSCGDFLEIFTETSTYRVHSPDSVDPEQTDPNAPWVSIQSSELGSSHKIVARTLLQGEEMIKTVAFERGEQGREAAIRRLHNAKEALCVCEKMFQRISAAEALVIAEIEEQGVELEHGRHVKNLPQVKNLEDDAASFLSNIKRAIASICYMAAEFFPVERLDNNPKHLKKRLEELGDERYEKTIQGLGNFIDGSEFLIDLRNFQEHPGKRRTYIRNFFITESREVSPPVWWLSGSKPERITQTMRSAVDFCVSMAEMMLMHYVMASVQQNIPFYIQETHDDELDPKRPIKFRVCIQVRT